MGSQRARALRRRPAERKPTDLGQRIRAIVARHARLDDHGVPIKCGPSRPERARRATTPDPVVVGAKKMQVSGNDYKVILLDEAHAKACARELEALDGKPRRAYPCPRSKSGHFHTGTR